MATVDSGFDEVLDAAPRGISKRNPTLDYAPIWRGLDDAMDQLTHVPVRLDSGLMESDGTANFATAAQARLLQALFTNIHHSRLERNPADFEFQAHLYDASSFVADTEDAHGRSIESGAISIQAAGPRGLFVSIPADMGEHSFVNAIERIIGTSSHRFYVDARAGGRFDVSLVKSLTVPFPITGSPRSFVETMLKKMDAAVNGGYALHTSGPFHRDQNDLANAISALGIQHNLGALLVPNLTAKAVTQSGAWMLLGALARFTELSGIPIVCFGTPGAAAELYDYGKSVNSLRNKGGVSITSFRKEEAQWSLWAEYLWENYFAFAFRHAMPQWFPDALWKYTLGHTEIATKLASYVYDRREAEVREVLDEELLESYADVALKLDMAPLKALRHINELKPVQRSGVRRYADWLPLDSALMAVPGIDEKPWSMTLLPLTGEAS